MKMKRSNVPRYLYGFNYILLYILIKNQQRLQIFEQPVSYTVGVLIIQ